MTTGIKDVEANQNLNTKKKIYSKTPKKAKPKHEPNVTDIRSCCSPRMPEAKLDKKGILGNGMSAGKRGKKYNKYLLLFLGES